MKYLHYAPRAEDARLVAEAFAVAPDAGTLEDAWGRFVQNRPVPAEMPQLCEFYGIVIYMYRPDHPPAHFHARYGEHWARVALDGSMVLQGELPGRAFRLVQEWAGLHQTELATNWNLAQRLEALVPIDPLP